MNMHDGLQCYSDLCPPSLYGVLPGNSLCIFHIVFCHNLHDIGSHNTFMLHISMIVKIAMVSADENIAIFSLMQCCNMRCHWMCYISNIK